MDATQGDDDRELPSTLPGALIAGKYRIDALIGRGGMGSVWSAMHIGLGQRVAVKLIAKRYVTSREARQRFDIEAKAAAQLRSRFVVQIYDNGETADGIPYIVMEMLDGESLDHRIQRGPIPLDQAVRILAQVSRALARAHAVGIVHRDLKPENIFLTRTDEEDGGEIAKVLDFGIAKIKTPEGSDSATRTGTVLGTPLFMSPEQARGLKSVDHRTDIYSLGMVAYIMLTGQSAFSGESFGDILVAICTQPLPSLQQRAPWLPPALDGWLQRTCAREPGERYATIEQMLEGLYAAAGMGRPKTQEMMRGDSAGTGQIPPQIPQPTAMGGSPGTTSALTVTGDDIPKRSMLGPLLFIGAGLAAAAIAAFVLLRKPADAGDAALATSAAVAIAAPPAVSATAAPPPASAAPVASQAPVASAEAPARGPAQKGTTGPKPSGKLPEPAKVVQKAPPTPAKPKPSPDLGF